MHMQIFFYMSFNQCSTSVATQAKTTVYFYPKRKTADNGLFNDAVIFINYHSIISLTTQHFDLDLL